MTTCATTCASAALQQSQEKVAETGFLFRAYFDELQAGPPAGNRSDCRLINLNWRHLVCHLNLEA